MNPKQRAVLLAGLVVILLMGFFPPWRYTRVLAGPEERAGYGCLLYPPQVAAGQESLRVDISLLLAQWGVVAAATAIGVIAPRPSRTWFQFRLRTLMLFTLIVALFFAWWVSPPFVASSNVNSAVLLSRAKYNHYDKATFSFEHGLRDDPDGVTRNDWDIQFGNGGDFFHVTMVTDDCSRLVDLGELTWRNLRLSALPKLPAHPWPTREPRLPAKPGHMYLVHTKDSDSDLYALFRVESLAPGDRCEITWRIIDPK